MHSELHYLWFNDKKKTERGERLQLNIFLSKRRVKASNTLFGNFYSWLGLDLF